MKFQKSYTVRLYECTPDGILDYSFLLNYMMDAMATHTIDIKFTIPELLKQGLTWMLSRYHIIIDRHPAYMDTVNIDTWIADHKGLFSIRDYIIKGAGGNMLARMTSSWVLYDIRKKKIVNVEILPFKNILPERAIHDPFLTLPSLEHADHTLEFLTRKHDIDINKHVTNRVIAEWALETLPFKITETHELAELEITFKGQAFYGDKIQSLCQILSPEEHFTALHHIINKNSEQSIALARTQWRKK